MTKLKLRVADMNLHAKFFAFPLVVALLVLGVGAYCFHLLKLQQDLLARLRGEQSQKEEVIFHLQAEFTHLHTAIFEFILNNEKLSGEQIYIFTRERLDGLRNLGEQVRRLNEISSLSDSEIEVKRSLVEAFENYLSRVQAWVEISTVDPQEARKQLARASTFFAEANSRFVELAKLSSGQNFLASKALLAQNTSKLLRIGLGGAFALAIILLLTSRIMLLVLAPITSLLRTVMTVSKSDDYSLRAEKWGNDEVGTLVEAFNHMLETIAKQHESLQRYGHDLEKKVEERTSAIRDKEKELRATVESAADGIVTIDEHGQILSVNRMTRTIFGYSADELLGKNVTFLMNSHDAMHHHRYLSEYLLTGITRVIGKRREVLARRKDGTTFSMDLGVTEISLQERRMFMGVVRDLTENKKLQQQFIEMSHHAGMAEVATGVLHNVGNVLNSLNVSAEVITSTLRRSKLSGLTKVCELLEREKLDLPRLFSQPGKSDQLVTYVQRVNEEMQTERNTMEQELLGLVENVGHIKEIISRQQEQAKLSGIQVAVLLPELLEEALNIHREALTRYRIELQREYAQTAPLTLEKHKVLQILLNLISNARHAMDAMSDGQKMLILRSGYDQDARPFVEIEDTGVGIPEENLLKIFSYGFTTKKDGHGFGLHSSALAAKQIGAALTVESAGLGKGARFRLTFQVSGEESDSQRNENLRTM